MNLQEKANQLTNYFMQLRQVQNQQQAVLLEMLQQFTLPQLNVLNKIGDHPGSTMSQIANSVGLSLSSITLILNKLVQKKLVLRFRNEEDRRQVYAKLTVEGKKIYGLQINYMTEVSSSMLKVLSTEEQNSFLAIFKKLTEKMGQ